jgi:hypothetical protein
MNQDGKLLSAVAVFLVARMPALEAKRIKASVLDTG